MLIAIQNFVLVLSRFFIRWLTTTTYCQCWFLAVFRQSDQMFCFLTEVEYSQSSFLDNK